MRDWAVWYMLRWFGAISQYILFSSISSRLRCCTVHWGVQLICWGGITDWTELKGIEHHGLKICLNTVLKASLSLSLSPCCSFPLSTPPTLTGHVIHLERSVSCRYLLHSLCFSSLYHFLQSLLTSVPLFPSRQPSDRAWGEVKYAEAPLEVRIGRVAMKAQV